jgi:hypothetical protein
MAKDSSSSYKLLQYVSCCGGFERENDDNTTLSERSGYKAKPFLLSSVFNATAVSQPKRLLPAFPVQ